MTAELRRQVYLLSPRRLSPETIAVTFAKTSRSPLSFREIADELTDAKSAAFHEKWVVGYGHASVAEHAVLHLAFENVSRLAIECIESNRLASYTEKSTRYQKWDAEGYYVPQEVRESVHEAVYRSTCRRLFQEYLVSLEPVRAVVQQKFPRQEGESEERWEGRIRARYVDVCRFLLPAAALANVGMTANARALEHALRKMLSHPLDEVRQIGQEAKLAAVAEVPTLLKYADPMPYVAALQRELPGWAKQESVAPAGEPVRLLGLMPEPEAAALAAALYPYAADSLEGLVQRVQGMPESERTRLAQAVLGERGDHDPPDRSLEHTAFTFEIVLDQGAYFELKRHRMMTQSAQRLTTRLGYCVPRLISEAGQEPAYRESMAMAAQAYDELATWNPDVASYLVPNAFLRRVAVTMNLREAFHFCELRSAPNAHFSIRRIALRMAEVLQQAVPGLGNYLRLPIDASWHKIEEEHFTQVG
jgi:thymidylate synthase ThyX